MSQTPDVPEGILEPIRARRDALQVATTDLEHSLAAPSASQTWRSGVVEAAVRVQASLTLHVASDGTEDGLTATVIDAAPRLTGPAARLTDEHADLEERCRQLQQILADPDADAEAIRDAGIDLAARLLRHLQQAQDLFFDAFDSDLGGGD